MKLAFLFLNNREILGNVFHVERERKRKSLPLHDLLICSIEFVLPVKSFHSLLLFFLSLTRLIQRESLLSFMELRALPQTAFLSDINQNECKLSRQKNYLER